MDNPPAIPPADKRSYPMRLLEAVFTTPSLTTDLVGGIPTLAGAVVFLLAHLGILPPATGEGIAGWIALGGIGFVMLARAALAPYWVHRKDRDDSERLRARLDMYESGPRLEVTCEAPSFSSDGLQTTYLVLPLRVTNEGEPGAAFDWLVYITLASGQTLYFQPVKAANYDFSGMLHSKISREETIWERTAKRLERLDPIHGFYIGAYGADVSGILDDNLTMTVLWQDHRGRVSKATAPLGKQKPAAQSILVPTLSPFIVRPAMPPNQPPSIPGQ